MSSHPRRLGLLLLLIIGVLQVILVESSESSVSAGFADRRDLLRVRVGRANRATQETNDAGLVEEFQHDVAIVLEGRTRKHRNRSEPRGGGGGGGDSNKKNNRDEESSRSSDVGVSTMAKVIMAVMKERRHVSGGSDKSRGLYPKDLRDRVFDRLDIRNKGDEHDRDMFRAAIDRLVGKDLIRINKNGKVKLVISMDSSRSKRKVDDGDDDDDDDDDKDKQRDKQKEKVRDPYAATSDSGDDERDNGQDKDGKNDGKEETGQQQETSGGTNANLLKDSDGDGYTDAQEILKGSDPNDASSTPRNPGGNDTTSGGGGGAGSNGLACQSDQDCDSNVCVNNVCSRPKRGGESCDSPYDCLNRTCGKASLSLNAGSVCCETGNEDRGICTGQQDGSPCVLMPTFSPDTTMAVVLDNICASSYCNVDAGGICDTENGMPTDPGDGENSPREGDDVSAAGSSCDAGCIAAVTVPVSMFILIVLGAISYSFFRDEGGAVEGEMEAPIGMVDDDINNPMGSLNTNEDIEAQPLVASSVAVGGFSAIVEEDEDDSVYVDHEGEDGESDGHGDEEGPELHVEEAPEGEEGTNK